VLVLGVKRNGFHTRWRPVSGPNDWCVNCSTVVAFPGHQHLTSSDIIERNEKTIVL